MKPKVYLSIPIVLDFNEVVPVISRYKDTHTISFWGRGEGYNPSLLSESQAVIMFTTKNTWKTNFLDMPPGCRKELTTALSRNKTILLAYKNAEGKVNIYNTTYENNILSGISGTSNSMDKMVPVSCEPKILSQVKEPVENGNFDKRLLLTIST